MRLVIVIASAWTDLVDFDEFPIIIDVDVITGASLARIETVREARSLKAHIVKPAPIECLLGLVD